MLERVDTPNVLSHPLIARLFSGLRPFVSIVYLSTLANQALKPALPSEAWLEIVSSTPFNAISLPFDSPHSKTSHQFIQEEDIDDPYRDCHDCRGSHQ